MAVFASMVTHNRAGLGIWIGDPSVLHCVLGFVRPTAVWTGGNKQKSFMSLTHHWSLDHTHNKMSAACQEKSLTNPFFKKCWIQNLLSFHVGARTFSLPWQYVVSFLNYNFLLNIKYGIRCAIYSRLPAVFVDPLTIAVTKSHRCDYILSNNVYTGPSAVLWGCIVSHGQFSELTKLTLQNQAIQSCHGY